MDIVERLAEMAADSIGADAAHAIGMLRVELKSAEMEIERLRGELADAMEERAIDEQRVADLMGDVNVLGHENERLRADDVALASDLDELEIKRIAEQCGVRMVCGSLDGDWPALVRFARAIEQQAEWSAELCSVAERVNLLADIEDQRSME